MVLLVEEVVVAVLLLLMRGAEGVVVVLLTRVEVGAEATQVAVEAEVGILLMALVEVGAEAEMTQVEVEVEVGILLMTLAEEGAGEGLVYLALLLQFLLRFSLYLSAEDQRSLPLVHLVVQLVAHYWGSPDRRGWQGEENYASMRQ